MKLSKLFSNLGEWADQMYWKAPWYSLAERFFRRVEIICGEIETFLLDMGW